MDRFFSERVNEDEMRLKLKKKKLPQYSKVQKKLQRLLQRSSKEKSSLRRSIGAEAAGEVSKRI